MYNTPLGCSHIQATSPSPSYRSITNCTLSPLQICDDTNQAKGFSLIAATAVLGRVLVSGHMIPFTATQDRQIMVALDTFVTGSAKTEHK